MKIRSSILITLLTINILSVQAQGTLPLACAGSLARYGTEGLPNSTFEWTVTGGEIIANYNDSIDIRWGDSPGNFNIQVIEHPLGNCVADPYIASIAIEKAEVEIGDYIDLCEGQTASVSIPAGQYAVYKWSNNYPGLTQSVSQPGKLWVDVANGDCKASDTVYVSVNSIPEIDLGEDVRLCSEQTYILDAGDYMSEYKWSTGETTQEIEVGEGAQAYFVTIKDLNNCENSDTINILACIPRDELKKKLMTAISPNGDGKNDVFNLPEGIYGEVEVEIYDRWGRMVFKSDVGYSESWDGTFKGEELPTDTYFYIIKNFSAKGDYETGNISIFRGKAQ